MADASKSPPPVSSDRLWYWFAVSSVILVTVLAISPVKDYFSEYRPIQKAYRELLLREAGSARELARARQERVAIRQIWMPDFENRVDRCTTCHLGVEHAGLEDEPEPFRTHPLTPHTPDDFPRFGCTICHGGQGRATSVAQAHRHVPGWDKPLVPLAYTESSCGRCHEGDLVPEAPMLSAGRALMERVGCYGCHRVPGHEDWSSSQAPDLDGLSLKTNPAWLRAWLKDPRSLRPATWMPNFHLDDAAIDDLVAFLWAQPAPATVAVGDEGEPPEGDPDRGKKIFGQSRCVSCHTIEGRGNGSAPELAGIGSKVKRRWLVAFLADPHAFQPHTLMPRYNFSRQDVLDLSQYLMDEWTDPAAPAPGPSFRPAQRAVQRGEALYRALDCGGCHRMARIPKVAPIGPDLAGIGDKPVTLLDFGLRDDLPETLVDWLAAKVSDPRSFRENLKMPDFGFTQEQIQQILTALLAMGEKPVPPAYRVTAERPHETPPGRFGALVDEYRCLSCHRINGVGGDISRAPLTAEGSRVKRDWLVNYLLRPSALRPILTDRMIPLRMPEPEARFMADFMQNVYVDKRVPVDIFPDGPSPKQIERGRRLFHERFGCQSCHMVKGKGGYYGPILDGSGDRLRPEWIAWWLKGPQRWRADVRCPDYGIEDQDARDLAAYIDALTPEEPSTGGGP
ncbi:MAG: c-type cytochrome [Acidobacteriota bacterium]